MHAAKKEALNKPALNSRNAYSPNGFSAERPPRPLLMSRGLYAQIAPAQATMMKNATTDVMMQPTITSMRDCDVLLGGNAFLHYRRLQIELHPRRDGGAHHADQHIDIAGIEHQHRLDAVDGRLLPVRRPECRR